jgi:hypothetical protein
MLRRRSLPKTKFSYQGIASAIPQVEATSGRQPAAEILSEAKDLKIRCPFRGAASKTRTKSFHRWSGRTSKVTSGKNRPPERRSSIAQRFSARESSKNDPSPGGTTEFYSGILVVDERRSRTPYHQLAAKGDWTEMPAREIVTSVIITVKWSLYCASLTTPHSLSIINNLRPVAPQKAY